MSTEYANKLVSKTNRLLPDIENVFDLKKNLFGLSNPVN